MAYSHSDFTLAKSGPQFAWLDNRLTVHGFPPLRLADTLKDRVQRFQQEQGWRGSGADGLVGPETLRRLTLDPDRSGHGIDTSIWKVTGPEEDEDGGAIEHFPIEGDYDPWFVDTGHSLIFRARVDGATTSKSGYPRSELREMTKGGKLAKWSNRTGVNRMRGRFRVNELPGGKNEVVPAQVHDPYDDVVMIVVSGSEIFLSESKGKGQGSNRRPIGTGYRLGDWVEFEIVTAPGQIKTTVNGKSLTTYKVVDDAYYKAGSYSQANETNGSGAAEVEYDDLEVEHV